MNNASRTLSITNTTFHDSTSNSRAPSRATRGNRRLRLSRTVSPTRDTNTQISLRCAMNRADRPAPVSTRTSKPASRSTASAAAPAVEIDRLPPHTEQLSASSTGRGSETNEHREVGIVALAEVEQRRDVVERRWPRLDLQRARRSGIDRGIRGEPSPSHTLLERSADDVVHASHRARCERFAVTPAALAHRRVELVELHRGDVSQSQPADRRHHVRVAVPLGDLQCARRPIGTGGLESLGDEVAERRARGDLLTVARRDQQFRQLGLSMFLRASHRAGDVTAAARDRVSATRHDQLPALAPIAEVSTHAGEANSVDKWLTGPSDGPVLDGPAGHSGL